MSDAIAPALTLDEWARIPRDISPFVELSMGLGDFGAVIAAANAALPANDPRKISWATVNRLRHLAELVDHFLGPDQNMDTLAAAIALADTLASYLPPEPT